MSDKRLIDMRTLPNYKLRITARLGEFEMPGDLRIVFWEDIEKAPTIDAVEVVRCMECKESEKCPLIGADNLYCNVWDTVVHCDGFCYQGAKMDGGASDGSDA